MNLLNATRNVILSGAKNLYDYLRDSSLSLRVTCLLVSVAAMMLVGVKQVEGQSGIEIASDAVVKFGESITFGAQVKAPSPIQQAFIFIQDDPQGRPIQLNDVGYTEYRLPANEMILRPFTFVRWHYQFMLADGSTVDSENFFIRYDDNRFEWQKVESGGMRVMWSQGDAAFGQSALNTALTSLQKINEIVPSDLSQPVDIYVYASQNDLPANLSLSGATWLVGHADPSLGTIAVVIEPGSDQNIITEQRIPHELMHVMLYRRIGAGYSNLPAWLNEGIAMQAELYPNAEYDRALADASARGGVFHIKDLCASFPANSADAFLAYAEARSFTTYLRGIYGSDGLLNLAGIYATGVDCERGTERAFGVPLAKLEMDWRTAVLGENVLGSMLKNLTPYLVLLLVVIFVPLLGIINSMRSTKGKRNEPETYARR